MADRTQLRVADNNDVADDDPFAELTRIMGFDPRQPVKPQAPAVEKAAPSNQLAEEGDFDIDLEKELMGEFGADDGIANVQGQQPAFETAAADDKLAASFEQDFVFEDADEADHHFAAATGSGAPAPVVNAAFDDVFDNAVASSLEDVSPLEDDLPMDEELAASLDQEFVLDDHAAHEAEQGPVAEFAAPAIEAEEAGFDDDFDNAVSTSLEDELTLDDHLPSEEHHTLVAADDPAPVDAGDHSISEDFGGHFDDAMADVDMDFEARSFEARTDQPAELDEPLDNHAAAETVDARDAEVTAQEAFDDDFDLNFGDELAEEPVAEVADVAVEPDMAAAMPAEPMAAAAVAAAPAVAPAAADERSLEDELNALLGAMTARPLPVAPVSAAPISATKEPAIFQPPVAAAEKIADEHLMGDLDWDLDEHEPAQSQHHAVVQAAGADDLLADELEAKNADIEFDHDAFDAAFAKGIDLGHDELAGTSARAASGEGQTHSPDWLRSTPPEPARSWSRVTPVAAPSQASFAAQPMASAPQVASAPASAAPSYRHQPVEDVSAYAEPEPARHEQPYDEMPEVETVDVPERVVALADDLDIPELSFEEDQQAASAYDDLDAEFSGLLNEMNATEVAPAPARSGAYEDDTYSAGFKPGHDRVETRSYAGRPAEVPASRASGSYAAAASGFDVDNLPGSQPASQADDFAVDELDYDPELDEAMAVPGLAERDAQPRRRGLLIVAVVGAVAIAGGLGAFALSFGGKAGSSAPVIVKADNAPIKVKPENPGGTVVPNQDNKVYDAVVKGTRPAEPVQEKLVTNTEEPVDVAAKEPQSRVVDLSPNDTNAAPGTAAAGNADTAQETGAANNADAAVAPAPKSEDRIAQVLQDAEKSGLPDVVAVAPRKVRTMMVKPDGSLVAREDPAPAAPQVAAAEPIDPAPQHVAPAQADAGQTGTVAPLANAASDQASDQGAADQTETAKPVKPTAAAKPAAAAKAEAKAQSTNTPATVPVAPQRPSDQPVDVVGEVKPDQVASIDPATASAGGGSWSMQIASQPTVESAQSTYQDLQRRYGSVLSGHTANIVKAEIAGKGTFYRIRVPAQSRNDAINLCTSYKAAGGNCFVSR